MNRMSRLNKSISVTPEIRLSSTLNHRLIVGNAVVKLNNLSDSHVSGSYEVSSGCLVHTTTD